MERTCKKFEISDLHELQFNGDSDMEWKKEYEIGVNEIDSQHKTLVSIICDYKTHLSDEKIDSYNEIKEILIYLANYTNYHFEAEELLMEAINYPKLEEHKDLHNTLKSNIKEILIKMKEKRSYTKIEFYYFLMDWLNSHILEEDHQIGDFIHKNSSFVPQKIPLRHINDANSIIHPKLNILKNLYDSSRIDEVSYKNKRERFLIDFLTGYDINDNTTSDNVIKTIINLHQEHFISTIEVRTLNNCMIKDHNPTLSSYISRLN